jgi:hypothetical protein
MRRADVRIKMIAFWAVLLLVNAGAVAAQQAQDTQDAIERPVSLTEPAVARDAQGAPALEATLRTTALNGAPESPVTNIRLVIRNVSPHAYSYVSGLVTFYDNAQVRCGEGVFKADTIAANESFETDTPGIRIRCTPASWRIVATNLLRRVAPGLIATEVVSGPSRLLISIDGEEHPIQLDKPMVLNVGDRQRTIIVRQSP